MRQIAELIEPLINGQLISKNNTKEREVLIYQSS